MVDTCYEKHGTICTILHTEKSSAWILGMVATDHVVIPYLIFNIIKESKYTEVTRCFSSLNSQYCRNYQLSFSQNTFTLTNVLYTTAFTFNLISLSKMIESLICQLTFIEDVCHIQNKS